jgi:WD40 repeat protein
VAARRQLHETATTHAGTSCVAFSPDGKALVSAAGYALRLWDVPSWKERFPLAGHTTQIDALAYSPDGKTLASGGAYDNRLLLWDVGTAKVRRALDCEQQGVFCATFSPDGKSVAAGLTDNGPPHRVVAVWDADSGKRLRRLESHFGASSMAFSPDGKRLAASGSAGISVWDAANGERLAVLQPNGEMIHSLAFLRGGKSLLFTSYKLPLSEWDVATGNERRQFEGKALPYLRMELAPGGRYVAVGWRYGTDTPQKNPIRIWEVATGQEVAALCPDYSMADEIAYSPDGRLIACLRHDATIRVHDILTGDELRRFRDASLPKVIAFAPDGKTLASAGWDTTITLWDAKDLTKRKAPRRDPLSAERLAALWSDLSGGDAAKAYDAVRALARVPDQAVPLLRQRLARPAAADNRIGKWIADLDDDEFDVRERASAELERLGAAAEAALRKALEGKPSAEAKRRIESLLAKRSPAGVSSERLTALRALEVLELAATPEARRLIKSLAEGTPGAPATIQARETLERLGR